MKDFGKGILFKFDFILVDYLIEILNDMDRTARTVKCNLEQLLQIISMSRKADSASQSILVKATYSPRPRKMHTHQPSSEI